MKIFKVTYKIRGSERIRTETVRAADEFKALEVFNAIRPPKAHVESLKEVK